MSFVQGMRFPKPPPDHCQVCAAKHNPDDVHNAGGLFYQYHFFEKHLRWPTWRDAMAHCSQERKDQLEAQFKEKGFDIDQVVGL